MTELQIVQENLRQLKDTVDRMWDMFEVIKWHAAQYLDLLIEQELSFDEMFDKMVDRYGIAIALDFFKEELGLAKLRYREMLDLKIEIARNYGENEPLEVKEVVDTYLGKMHGGQKLELELEQ